MNQKQWKKLTHSIDKPKDFWYWRNKAVEYFNLQKGQVIHHLRDTKEQRIFNDNYYERWGFDFNEEMKYCICISKEEHSELHRHSERRNDSRHGMYRADRIGIWSSQSTRSFGKRTGTYHRKMQWKHYKKCPLCYHSKLRRIDWN